jgi:hypothetical protein
MKLLMIAIVMTVAVATPLLAEENQPQQARKGSVRVQDLPKPIPDLLDKIQQLSRKIEPEISRLGGSLGQELKVTVKKLCDELQCQEPQERPDSK